MEKLSKAPLNVVTLRLEFNHNLKVAEKKSEYYELIKQDLPLIVIPEIKDLTYDFADCHFRTANSSIQIRIATNYFIYETINYSDVEQFWLSFKDKFLKFIQCFSIEKLNSLRLTYDNNIKVDVTKITENFSDYFAFHLGFKGKQPRKFLTVDGAFVFSLDNGAAALLEIHPRQNKATLVYDTVNLKIEFLTSQPVLVQQNLEEIEKQFRLGHSHIEDLFFSSLTEKYLQEIK